MKHKQSGIYLLLPVAVVFCGCKQEIYHPVKFSNYTNGEFKEERSGFFVDSVFNTSNKLYQYYDKDTDLMFRFDIQLDTDTTVSLNFDLLQKNDEKEFIIDNELFKILKYDYDLPGLIDEESYIFFNDKYELICKNNVPWGISKFIESNRVPKSIQILLLKKENELFFDYSPRIDSF